VDYLQGVVIEYLRANRPTFVKTECCIQLNQGDNPYRNGPHWFCDALAINVIESGAYLGYLSPRASVASGTIKWPR
jgi:hypothetical protein